MSGLRSREERLAYGRGYNAGSAGRWPDLSTIPEPLYRELAEASEALSCAVDGLLAQFDDRDDDESQIAIDAARDRVAAAVESARAASLARPEPPA